MAISRDTFIENYLDELKETLEIVDSGILRLKKEPENEDELAKLLRALHTIKGSSRMLKFTHIEKIAHGLENVFKGVKDKKYDISKPLIQLVFITTDYIRAGSERIKTSQTDELPIAPLLDVFEKASANTPYTLEGLKENLQRFQAERNNGKPSEGGESKPLEKPIGKEAIEEYETIRIKLSKTDMMTKLLNNLIIKQFQLRRENDVLNGLERKFRELMAMKEVGNGKNGEKSPEYLKRENDFLKHLQQLRKDFGLDLAQLEVNTFELQEEILSLRMLPLQLILGSLPKMVEETAISLDKEIDFSMSGTDVMIDKIILEKLNDPIIHLVRNSIDHGIETPDIRERKGKNRVGRIEISSYLEGGNILVRIKDDGKGINYDVIREKAVRLNPAQEDEIRLMDHGSLTSFLFASGFSTREQVQELSGRGVGLDIVKYNIENIKGKIDLKSEKDKGTEFILTLPLSLATIEGFFISSAQEKFLIPSTFVNEVLIITEADLLNLADKRVIKLRDKIIPIYELNAILGKQKNNHAKKQEKIFVLVVESVGNIIGIVVDSIIQYASLIYKPLPPNLNKLSLIQGIVFDESYNITNILFIPEIINRFKRMRGVSFRKKAEEDSKVEHKSILVVDDSYSTREIERSILELEDFHVVTANDGLEGLEQIKQRHIDLVITDINMPNMDGLEFVEKLRGQPEYAAVPVIVVSSIEDPETRKQFESFGISSYIIKSDFERGNLVSEVKHVLGV